MEVKRVDVIGKSVIRKDALEKVTGTARYTNDYSFKGSLHAKIVVSPYAHARIQAIDVQAAIATPGVHAVVTGEHLPLTGEGVRDRRPLAFEKVRYHGEAVVLVVAENPALAERAASAVHIQYEPLPVVHSPSAAIEPDSPLVHEHMHIYKHDETVYPEPGTNVANRVKIRKGNMEEGWQKSELIVEETFSLSPSDHAAMETRSAAAEILPNGLVKIITSSQAPFMVKKLISEYFEIEAGKVIVETPLVGGGYGGKAAVQLELLAYIASKAVGGRLVKILNTREEDMLTSPAHIGLDAKIKLGCSKEGLLQAADILYLFDSGAYADKGTDLSKAAAADCTGPYRLEHIVCDSLCVYTNHPYASPFRGFSHSELLFAFERTMDILAKKAGIDPLEFREKNAILPGDTTPTQVRLTSSSVGNLPECIRRLKQLIKWEEGQRTVHENGLITAKGISCVWKTSTIETNAGSGVILTFNPDGSVNLMSGVIELGTGTKTVLAQILAEKLQMRVERIHVRMEVDTQTTPEHWKTVASRGTFMAGRAVLEAAEDVINQLKKIASCIFRASEEDIEIKNEKVFLRDEPETSLKFKEIVYGYKYPNGNAIGGQIIGRGNYILRGMTYLDKETGAGRPGPEWTVAAEGVEVEYNPRTYRYRIVKAVSVIDIGTVLNEKMARGQVMGAMSMGLSFAGRETFWFDSNGRILNPQLRKYRPLRYGEHPEYVVNFVHTPQLDAAYGARGVGEHGLLGMPASLGNSLTVAAETELNQLPLIPELIWRMKEGNADDFV